MDDETTRTFSRYSSETLRLLAHEAASRPGCESLLAMVDAILATRAARPAAIEARINAIRLGWEAWDLARVIARNAAGKAEQRRLRRAV